jgi:hypothetical protein
MQSDDINFRGLVIFLGILLGTLVVAYFSLTAMWRGFERKASLEDAHILQEGPTASARSGQPYFPLPREQPAPQVDLEAFRAREDAEINSYGWVDKKAGIVRIPIDRAMELLTPPTKGQP